MTGQAYLTLTRLNSNIVIKEVQRGLFQAYWRGTRNPLCDKFNMPLRSFLSRNECKEYLLSTEIQ